MISEKFIQDAFTNVDRITRVLRDLNIYWVFRDGATGRADAVTQEFSFAAKGEGGRIDILATFENRTKVMICEVKSGIVGDAQAEQLRWYVDNWKSGKANIADDSVSGIREVTGILLAEDFEGMSEQYRNHPNLHFVKFDRDAKAFPFTVVQPTLKVIDQEDEQTPAMSSRQSWLWLADEKSKHFSSEVKNAFYEWLACFLKANDPRRKWIVTSIKNSHISVHYKSVYVTYIKTNKESFSGSYGIGNDNNRFSSQDDLSTVKPRMQEMLNQIDEEFKDIIPQGCEW